MATSSPEPDKDKLYGIYQKYADDALEHKRKMSRWFRSAAHKSLDMPDPEAEMNNSVTSTVNKGMTWRELAAIGALTGGIGTGAYVLGGTSSNPSPDPVPVVADERPGIPDTDTRSTTRIRLFE